MRRLGSIGFCARGVAVAAAGGSESGGGGRAGFTQSFGPALQRTPHHHARFPEGLWDERGDFLPRHRRGLRIQAVLLLTPACERATAEPKTALIDAVDRALRQGSSEGLARLYLPDEVLRRACPILRQKVHAAVAPVAAWRGTLPFMGMPGHTLDPQDPFANALQAAVAQLPPVSADALAAAGVLLTTAQVPERFRVSFGKTFRIETERWLRPRNVEELARSVQLAETEGQSLKAIGSLCTWSPAARPDDGGYALITEALDGVADPEWPLLRVKPPPPPAAETLDNATIRDGRHLIRVGAGSTLWALSEALAERGLGLKTLGGYGGERVGGAMSTGTHGSSIFSGPICDWVRSLDVVWRGVPVRLEPKDGPTDPAAFAQSPAHQGWLLLQDDEVFHTTRISYGTMGVVFSYLIEVAPRYYLEEKRVPVPLETVREEMRAVIEGRPGNVFERAWSAEFYFNLFSTKPGMLATRVTRTLIPKPATLARRNTFDDKFFRFLRFFGIDPGRDTAMVFQSYALYPHMTVRENMAFGLTLRKMAKDEIARRVDEAAKLLALSHLLERKPKQLSGGQRQRVAMGRAIVRQPSVFLFDEPLSNLDTALRVQMRGELARLHRRLNTTMIYVTHDQVEAMTLATRVAVFNQGYLQQCGHPLELYNRPANKFVAGFLGSPSMNFLTATRENGTLRGTGFSLPAPAGLDVSGEVLVGLRPQDLLVSADGPLRGEIEAVERLGFDGFVFVQTAAGPVAARFDRGVQVAVGDQVSLSPSGDALHVFSADGGQALRHPEPKLDAPGLAATGKAGGAQS